MCVILGKHIIRSTMTWIEKAGNRKHHRIPLFASALLSNLLVLQRVNAYPHFNRFPYLLQSSAVAHSSSVVHGGAPGRRCHVRVAGVPGTPPRQKTRKASVGIEDTWALLKDEQPHSLQHTPTENSMYLRNGHPGDCEAAEGRTASPTGLQQQLDHRLTGIHHSFSLGHGTRLGPTHRSIPGGKPPTMTQNTADQGAGDVGTSLSLSTYVPHVSLLSLASQATSRRHSTVNPTANHAPPQSN